MGIRLKCSDKSISPKCRDTGTNEEDAPVLT